jgi:hypothetical protein
MIKYIVALIASLALVLPGVASEAAAQKVVTTPSGAKAQTAVLQPANADASKAVAFYFLRHP